MIRGPVLRIDCFVALLLATTGEKSRRLDEHPPMPI